MRRLLMVAMMVTAGIVAAPGVASAFTSSSECKQAVTQLRAKIAALVPASGAPEPGSAKATEIKEKASDEFVAAQVKHPSCRTEFAALGKELAGNAAQEVPHGTPFLGPIGWLWNEIYYTIFQGNTVLMIMFGWELFLSPLILVFCAISVFRGTAGLLKKPYVPPELRTNEG